jgi:hypothetical protein
MEMVQFGFQQTPCYSSGQNYDSGETTMATTQSSGQLIQGHRRSVHEVKVYKRQERFQANGKEYLWNLKVCESLHSSNLE